MFCAVYRFTHWSMHWMWKMHGPHHPPTAEQHRTWRVSTMSPQGGGGCVCGAALLITSECTIHMPIAQGTELKLNTLSTECVALLHHCKVSSIVSALAIWAWTSKFRLQNLHRYQSLCGDTLISPASEGRDGTHRACCHVGKLRVCERLCLNE